MTPKHTPPPGGIYRHSITKTCHTPARSDITYIPTIDCRATGLNLRLIMDQHSMSVRELKDHLGLASIQSVYHWLNGICLPSIDNLYAMSALFGLSIDDLLRGDLDMTIPATQCTSPFHHSPIMLIWESDRSDTAQAAIDPITQHTDVPLDYIYWYNIK